jgi:hypothetical protein
MRKNRGKLLINGEQDKLKPNSFEGLKVELINFKILI